MYITSATVTYGRNVQLKQYHNARLEVTLVANLEDGDLLTDVMDTLWTRAKFDVQREVLHLVEVYKAKEKGAE